MERRRNPAPAEVAAPVPARVPAPPGDLRVLIVADNASELYGGEAVLPLRYFQALRARGVPAWLVTHARVRAELTARMPEALDRIHFIEDSPAHRLLWRLGRRLDHRLSHASTQFLSRLLTQAAQRRLARTLIEREGVNVVHQPTPVSPREPSILRDLGAPVVFGPMNGAADFPPAFRDQESRITRRLLALGRTMTPLLSRMFAGKRDAAVLLIANERSRAALFEAAEGKVFSLPENGVDTALWRPVRGRRRDWDECRFVFVGRLIRSKGVDLWIEAFKKAARDGVALSGTVVGDGPELPALVAQARSAGLLASRPNEPGRIHFAGWQPPADLRAIIGQQDCLVFPTLCECGGAVLLEAMAMELPVITTDWGGPADYVDGSCGILVAPDGRDSFIDGLAQAMRRLAADPTLRARLGQAGRRKIELFYTWDSKIECMIGHYRRAIRSHRRDLERRRA